MNKELVHSDLHPDHISSPIDAVVIWVDGDDPAHREKLNKYLQTIGHQPRMAKASRFRETGEFAYCIASMLRFAPWLRKIYIVSDAQEPSFMASIKNSPLANRIEVVDHTTIFYGYEDNLPTFNSRSIATVLWRIPGLSEQFLFLNDDFILLKPVSPKDFFNNNKLIVTGQWRLQHKYRIDKILEGLFCRNKQLSRSPRPKLSHAQARAAEIAGYQRRFFSDPHVPHPQFKSDLQNFYTNNPAVLRHNIQFRIRSGEQFLPDALGTHLAFRQSKAKVSNRLSSMIFKMAKISHSQLRLKLALAGINKRLAFACIQDLEWAKPETREVLFEWLDRRIGKLDDLI